MLIILWLLRLKCLCEIKIKNVRKHVFNRPVVLIATSGSYYAECDLSFLLRDKTDNVCF